jgi:NAD+ synthase
MWPGQKDEDELGMSYEEADQVLYHLIDLNYSLEDLEREGFDPLLIKRIMKRINDSEFKRKPQLKPMLSTKASK